MNERGALSMMVLALALGGCRKAPDSSTKPERVTAAAKPAAEPGKLLRVSDPAPEIEAVAHTGQNVKLSALRGHPVVVYFYPKDDTPGCTVEAQELRDDFSEFGKRQVTVLGVSMDDNESHRAFAAKHNLPFLLLPDPDHRIADAFGVPVVNGHAKRITFVIDKDGKIARVFPDVTPRGHAAEVLEAVSKLQS